MYSMCMIDWKYYKPKTKVLLRNVLPLVINHHNFPYILMQQEHLLNTQKDMIDGFLEKNVNNVYEKNIILTLSQRFFLFISHFSLLYVMTHSLLRPFLPSLLHRLTSLTYSALRTLLASKSSISIRWTEGKFSSRQDRVVT